jgi:sec-independent protein translocase protein TatB
MGLTEILLILFVALIVFGPEDLPDVARALGKIVYQIRKYTTEITREIQEGYEAPAKIINEAINNDAPKRELIDDQPEIIVQIKVKRMSFSTYDDQKGTAEESKASDNPLAELPSDMVLYSKEETSR